MIRFTIDDQEISVPKGTTVYEAAKQHGIDIPIFCYHDRMPPFGACRVCLVEVEKMGKLQASCTLQAIEGMVVKTKSDNAVSGRQGILELLLINHPLDCPICDRGGECPLQDNALQHGPGESRFFEEKRRFKKPLPLGPVLMLDRERCITCARCTRFGELIAGDHALEFIQRGYRTEVGTPDGKPAESKFIGNTIQICPVGALTSQVYRFRSRPWDNKATSSTCTLCPIGCSLVLDTRDGDIVRTRAQEDKAVNDIWLCDKGWFGYSFSSHPDRLTQPLLRKDAVLRPASWEEALSLIADKIKTFKADKKLAGFGGNPLTVEENYLFQQLMREGAGTEHLDHRIGTPLFTPQEEWVSPGMEISMSDCETLSFIYLVGIDLTEEFPLLWLRIKQALNAGGKAFFIGHYAPEIAPYLSETVVHPPGQELEKLNEHLTKIGTLAETKKTGAFFIGRQYLHSPNRSVILEGLIRWKKSYPHLSINLLEGRGNSLGARFAGMHPHFGPLGKPIKNGGLNAVQVLQETAEKGWDFLYVAGANPKECYPSKLWKQAREKLNFLVVQDLFMTETAKDADVVLPALSFLEKEGTFLNIEGRSRKIHAGKKVPEGVLTDGEIFTNIGRKLGIRLAISEEIKEALNKEKVHKIQEISEKNEIQLLERKTDDKGMLATFAPALFDHGVRMQHNGPLLKLAKQPYVRIHPAEARKRGLNAGDRVEMHVNGQGNERVVCGEIQLDTRVAENTIVLPIGFKECAVHELDTNLLNGLEVLVIPGKSHVAR